MNKIGHRNGAVVCMTAFFLVKGVSIDAVVTSVGIYFGAFIPDMDADYSYIQHLFPKLAKMYKLLPKNRIFKHRGLFLHSFYTLLFLFLLYNIIGTSILLGLFLGVLSHHVLDYKIKNYFKLFKGV